MRFMKSNKNLPSLSSAGRTRPAYIKIYMVQQTNQQSNYNAVKLTLWVLDFR